MTMASSLSMDKKVAKVPVEFSREKDILDTPESIYHQETLG